MPKMKSDRITGIVALSYLVLIPVAGIAAWQKIKSMDNAVAEMWEELNMPSSETTGTIHLNSLKRKLLGR